MTTFLQTINGYIWGIPLLVLILGCGIYLTVGTGFVQIRLFPQALRSFLRQVCDTNKENTATGYRALCTALSATVGTGNIVGVAGAIALGGPGAIFWMWIFAFFGMAVKFAEAVLAVRYRIKTKDGSFQGGPMHIIENGLGRKWKFLAVLYSFFGVIAAFGVGNATQINTVVTGINGVITGFGGTENVFVNILIGIALAIFIGISLLGGARRIGRIAQLLIPFACIGYIVMCCIAIILRLDRVGDAVISIVKGAFSPAAVTSGALGSGYIALRIGASRGLFTNEAGMGTASIAHAAANVKHPVEQGLMGIIEVFLDTILICTLTALVILTSNITIPYGVDVGLDLTAQAFSEIFGNWIRLPISFFICLFAIATVLGWGLYGAMCGRYLFGERALKGFVVLQVAVVIISVLLKTQTVWILSEAVNGMMAFPNLVALIGLSPELLRLTRQYKRKSPPVYERRGRNQPAGKKVCTPAEFS